MDVQAIVTAPPYASFLKSIAAHPLVSGLRLNTVMPLRDGPPEALERLADLGKPLWVDLKARQLRVAGAAIPPFTEITLSHPIEVKTPVDAFFNDGTEHARVVAVDGRRLILEDGPRRLIGPGESVNIVHPSLKIHGMLTKTDQAYLEAMKAVGLKQVMLSYVESPTDVEAIQAIMPDAEIILKIETNKGLDYAQQHGASYGRLMAARGDLYVEVLQPHKIINALRTVIAADPRAIAASRILDSLAFHPVPASADIGDLAFLLSLGYRTFLLGDALCLREDTLLEALNLLDAVAQEFVPPTEFEE
jgi:pyruvate kinase